jgi:TRAP transporter TAXI family solute receptor
MKRLLASLAAAVLSSGAAFASPPDDGAAASFNPDAIPAAQNDFRDENNLESDDPSHAREYFLAIYGGSTKGTYFYVASAICAAVNASFDRHHIRCVSLRSQGDASNVALMAQGRAQFIIIQSNTNDDAAGGRIALPTGRSVMSLHDELGLLVVRHGASIRSVGDLRGKRINLGPKDSASRQLWETLLAAEGIRKADLGTVYSAAQDLNQRGLCDGYLDAFGLWIGHPAPPISRSIANCRARIVGMRTPAVEKMVADHPYFFWGEIPAGTYPGQTEPIASYGFKATLVADRRVDPYLVYWLTRSIQENLDLFRAQHRALSTVDPRAMFEKGNFLPFHEGAARYWREIGWLRDDAAK